MDLHERWSHRWRNKKTDPFASPVDGIGVIANQTIAPDEVIIVYGGIVVPMGEIEEYRKECGHAGIQLSDDFFMVPSSREELETQGIINHSCEPNAGFRSQVELVAIREIKKDEEIFLDYAFLESHFAPFDCHCESSTCRGKVTPDDWQLPDIQKAYGKYFAPYLKAKFSHLPTE